jgi:DNA helicase-4
MTILNRIFKLVRKKTRKVEKVIESSVKHDKIDVLELKKAIEKLDHPEILEGLDDGQKSAVISENSRILVLAGAGAGKTRVLLYRILHLIRNCHAKSGNILAMTFTKDATLEMKDRLISFFEPEYAAVLNKKINPLDLKVLRMELFKKHPETRSITIKTIHSLCYSILKIDGAKIFNTNFQVVRDEDKNDEYTDSGVSQQKIIKSIIFKIGEDDPNFIEYLKKFIYDYLIDYKKLNGTIEESTNGKYVTLDGKDVRSKSERDIANFLVQNNIRYYYESEATWVEKSDESKKYRPDFYLPDFDIYIEHWWISSPDENIPEIFKEKFDKDKYLKEREWKLGQFKTHKKILIESSEKQMQGKLSEYYEYLYGELLKNTHGAIKYTPSVEFIQKFKHLNDGLSLLITSFMKIINLAKSNKINDSTILKNLEDEKHEEIIEFYNLLLRVYKEYEEFLVKNSFIDFNDMIHKVIDLFNKDKKILFKYQKKFKNILVDEYQDVSFAQVELIKLLLTEDNNLFAVGDDWQSIYGFRGSEVEFIVKFDEVFKNSKIIILPFNYRSGRNIVEASNLVILKNPNQVKKQIKAFNESKDEKIFQFNALNDIDSAQFIMDLAKKLYSEGCNYQDILLLYRRSRHIFPYKEYFKKQNFKINIKTIHGSKGLEAKIVFLVGLTCDGFPYVWEDSRIIQVIKKTDLLKKEEEERRIFYVAMTRAKERLILLSEKNNESSYCDDIPNEFKKVKISESEFKEEMLSKLLRDVLEKAHDGKNAEEIAKEMQREQPAVESYIAKLIELGLLDVQNFVDDKTYAVIASKIPKDEKRPRLAPIKRELSDRISYGQIRYVIADIRKNG